MGYKGQCLVLTFIKTWYLRPSSCNQRHLFLNLKILLLACFVDVYHIHYSSLLPCMYFQHNLHVYIYEPHLSTLNTGVYATWTSTPASSAMPPHSFQSNRISRLVRPKGKSSFQHRQNRTHGKQTAVFTWAEHAPSCLPCTDRLCFGMCCFSPGLPIKILNLSMSLTTLTLCLGAFFLCVTGSQYAEDPKEPLGEL